MFSHFFSCYLKHRAKKYLNMKSLFSCSMIFYCPKSRNLLVEYQAPFFYTLYISVISLFHCCVCLVYILPVT